MWGHTYVQDQMHVHTPECEGPKVDLGLDQLLSTLNIEKWSLTKPEFGKINLILSVSLHLRAIITNSHHICCNFA